MNVKSSPALKKFKKRFGNANHLLITTLIGLDGIASGLITEKPSEFSTVWNPRDKDRSAKRARVFVLKSFLGWAVESLEMYISELEKYLMLLDLELSERIYLGAGKSILSKVKNVSKEMKIDPVLAGLMEVLVIWRNYTFHYEVDNKLRKSTSNFLKSKEEYLRDNFSGLDIILMENTWKNGGDFTFKETASLINATQKYVQEIDNLLIDKLNHEKYYFEIVLDHLKKNNKSQRKYLSFGMQRKVDYLIVLMQNIAGVSEIENELAIKLVQNLKIELE